MTIDQAIEILKCLVPALDIETFRKTAKFYEAHDIAIKSLEAWEKVRAEIGIYEADCRLQGGTDECEKCNSNVFGSIYRIIDKYTAESEVQDADSD